MNISDKTKIITELALKNFGENIKFSKFLDYLGIHPSNAKYSSECTIGLDLKKDKAYLYDTAEAEKARRFMNDYQKEFGIDPRKELLIVYLSDPFDWAKTLIPFHSASGLIELLKK